MSDRALKRAIAAVSVVLIAVIAVGSVAGSRTINDDLRDRSEVALAAAGLDDVAITFRGREAAIRGGNDVEARLAKSLVSALPGVRRVDAVAPADDPLPGVARFELDRFGDDVEISGAVASPDDAAAIKVGVATALHTTIIGDVTVDPSVAGADWAAALPDVIEAVAGVRNLALEIRGDGTVQFGGEVDGAAARATVVRRVAHELPELRLISSRLATRERS